MDHNRVEGTVTEMGGKVKQAAGDLLGRSSMSAEGYYDEAEGRARNAFGQAKDMVKSQPVGALVVAGLIGLAVGLIARRA